jgi:hypothetical protein
MQTVLLLPGGRFAMHISDVQHAGAYQPRPCCTRAQSHPAASRGEQGSGCGCAHCLFETYEN